MKKTYKPKDLKGYLPEGHITNFRDNLGNAALLIAMLMVAGAILFLIISFADH